MVPFLVGTTAYNAHVQQMALSLHEIDQLAAYVTGGVDSFPRGVARLARESIRSRLPQLNRELERRAVVVPAALVRTRWRWELPRLIANRMGAARLEDWWWERGERALDAYCARQVASPQVGGFLGVEHGALASLRAARLRGKTGVVAFLSPHHATRVRWVGGEYEREPALRASGLTSIESLTPARDARRDEEAEAADWIVAGSSFTARSLVDAGVPAEKVLVVPLGGPEPIAVSRLPGSPGRTLTYLYVGTVAVHKGAHHLLRAWRHVARPNSELHLYGTVMIPESVIREVRAAAGGDAIFFHGSVPASTLPAVYQAGSVLVFPSLCDGFGMVVSEALANGLPVITTRNAGASDLIDDGRSGFVITPGDAGALVTAMQWCADHPLDLFEMRRAALAAAARRTWKDFRREFRETLVHAVDGPAEWLSPQHRSQRAHG